MNFKEKNKARVRALMADGLPRTNKAIGVLINPTLHVSTIDGYMSDLLDEGYVYVVNAKELAGGRSIAKIWRHNAAEIGGTNPFEWKTYKQWQPS